MKPPTRSRPPHAPVSVLVAGIGGFAALHHEVLHALEEEGLCRVLAACDPNAEAFAHVLEKWGFSERGVKVYRGFDEMMAMHGDQADMVSVATPIHCHATMHAECVNRQIACYLEKPPTLDPAEMHFMMQNEERNARFATNVGFNFQFEPARRSLKQRLLAGEFGALREVQFLGLSYRTAAYFSRNQWAGRLYLNDKLVLDSCCGNAVSHHLHNLLHWAGDDGVDSYAAPLQVTAELYRANPIESPDTVFASAVTDRGVHLRIAASHACAEKDLRMERIVASRATIEITYGQEYRVLANGAVIERGCWKKENLLPKNLHHYLLYLLGVHDRSLVHLKDCLPFVQLNALLYMAAPAIHAIPDDGQELMTSPNGKSTYRAVHGLGEAACRFIDHGVFPSAQALAWAGVGGTAQPCNLLHLNQKIRALCGRL